MSELRSFTFFKFDAVGTAPVFELGEFVTDDEARSFAGKLLDEGRRYDVVEVWNTDGQQFVIRR